MPPRRFDDKTESAIVEMYKLGLSAGKIGLILSCPDATIISILKRYNVDRRNISDCQRKYTINEHVFDIIDTEQKAYWLGFLFADGYVSSNDNSIVLTLSEKDKVHVELFAKFLSNNSPIKRVINTNNGIGFKSSCFFTRSFHLNKTLSDLGINVNRINPVFAFLSTPDHLKRHWIRGIFDGDGCCVVYKTRYIRYEFLGPMETLTSMYNYLSENGIASPSIPSIKQNTTIYKLGYHKQKTCYNLMNFMYKDSTIYLERKRNKAEEYFAEFLI